MKTTTRPDGTTKTKNKKTNFKTTKLNLKFPREILLLIFIFNLLAAPAFAADGMLCGTVSDLEKIFAENASPLKDAPPVDYIISKSYYDAVVINDHADITAIYDIEILTDDWLKIELIAGEFAIKEAKLDGVPVSLITKEGRHYLVLNNKAGKRNLKINFLIRINKDVPGKARYLKFGDLPETSISKLKIEIPETDIAVEIKPAIDTEIMELQNKTTAISQLTSSRGISVVWNPKKEEIIKKEGVPALIYADINTHISIGEGVMKCYSVISYSITQGSTSEFRIQIPGDINILNIMDSRGNLINDYKINDENNILLIQLPQDVSGNYKIILQYEKDMKQTSAVSNIPEIKTLDVEREMGHIGIEARTNVEINALKVSGVQRIDVNELPAEIQRQSKTPLLFGYKYLKHPYTVTLDIKKHEDIPVLASAIDYAKITTLLTDDGKSITKATYYVKNNRKQFLEVKLPKGSEMWGAFVSESPVKPAKSDDGKILIPLSRSLSGDSLYAFPVEFVYISEAATFEYFGKNNYEIPGVDIPISQVDLLLYLPDDYDFIKFEGNMKRVDRFGSYRYKAPPRAAAPRPPAPQVSNVRDYDEGDGMARTESASVDYEPVKVTTAGERVEEKATKQADTSAIVQKEFEDAIETGVLPVKINIPENGRAYMFSKFLVVEDKKLGVTATYINSEAYVWLGRLVLLFILFVGFYVVYTLNLRKNLRRQLIKILLIILVPLIISYFLVKVLDYAIFGWIVVAGAAVVYELYRLVMGYIGKGNVKKKVNKVKTIQNEKEDETEK